MIKHSSRIGRRLARTPALLPATIAAFGALLGACSGDVVNMGDNEPVTTPLPENPLCPNGVVSDTDVVVRNQAELDALEGCETITGALNIAPFEAADLRPLHALTSVGGMFAFDGPYECPGEDSCEGPSATETNRQQALDDAGWVSSLEGLESLERVGGLLLAGLSATDLLPLTNLRSLTNGGGLTLRSCPNLRDLSGLDNLLGVTALTLSCDNLESLAPLQLPREMSSLTLYGRLTELGTLPVATIALDLVIGETGLTTLDAFSKLEWVGGGLAVWRNPVLESLSGLDALTGTGALNVMENPRLERMAELRSLQSLDFVFITDNPLLAELPSFPALLPYPDLEAPQTVETFTVSGNSALQQLVLPLGWQAGGQVMIRDNASLRDIDLGQLRSADFVAINDNPVLGTIRLDSLARVDSLEVTGNPGLATTAFDAVQTFERTMTGNAAP